MDPSVSGPAVAHLGEDLFVLSIRPRDGKLLTRGRIDSALMATEMVRLAAAGRAQTERMDDDPGWRLLDPGELLHVRSTLEISSTAPFPAEPAHLLTVADLDPAAAASQHPQAAPR